MVWRALINTQTTSAPTQDSHVWCVCWWVRSVKVPSSFIGETAGANVLTIDRLVGVWGTSGWIQRCLLVSTKQIANLMFIFDSSEIYLLFLSCTFVRRSGTRWCWFVIRQFKLSGLKRPRRRVINFLMFSIVSDLIWTFSQMKAVPCLISV